MKAEVPTPSHSEAAAAVEYAASQEEIAEYLRRRRRVQHEVDPYPGEGECGEVAADLDKRTARRRAACRRDIHRSGR